MLRIWFNHWFSTAYNIISLIKQDNSDAVVIGSNNNFNSVIKCVCDEWYEEPSGCGDEYALSCVEFCRQHRIDVFIPRKEMLAVSKNIRFFEEAGIRVMVDRYDILLVLNDKSSAYEFMKNTETLSIPDYYTVTRADEFERAYNTLKERYGRVCMKLASDEGGRSFRVLSDARKSFDTLFKNHTFAEDVLRIIKEQKSFAPVMLMPYLPDDEISVDCLDTADGLIMLPREKNPTRIEKLIYDEKILGMCREIHKKTGLVHPFNVQFKYMDGVPYFLEINTRMSGGVQMGCVASGVNLPAAALRKLTGTEMKQDLCKEEKLVSYIEIPLVLNP